MITTFDRWNGETVDDSAFIQKAVNATSLLGISTVPQSDDQVAMHYDEQPIVLPSIRHVLDQVESYMHYLIRQRPLWRDVVVDAEPTLSRLYLDWDDDYRIFLHRIDSPEEESRGRAVLHYHQWQSIIRMHRGTYREILAYGDPESSLPPVVHSMQDVVPGSVREYLHKNLWHAVEPQGEPTFSTMIVTKNSWRTPIRSTDYTSKLRYPKLSSSVRGDMFEAFEGFYPIDGAKTKKE